MCADKKRKWKRETCPVVLEFTKRLRKKTGGNTFQLVSDLMTDDNMREFATSATGEEKLLWANSRIASSGRYLFWERILRNRACFSDSFIASLWYCLYDNKSFYTPLKVEETDGSENVFRLRQVDRELLSKSVVVSPLLLDCRLSAFRYGQVRNNGWETLRFLAYGMHYKTLPRWRCVRDSIKEDFVSEFAMKRMMSGEKLSFCAIGEILDKCAWKIFRHLLENELDKVERAIPLGDIACYAVATLPDRKAMPVLEMLEQVRPGILGGYRDKLGQGLLWYAMYNPYSCWFDVRCSITPFLIEHGCSPDAPTHVGLSWRFLTDSLDEGKKQYILCRHKCQDCLL